MCITPAAQRKGVFIDASPTGEDDLKLPRRNWTLSDWGTSVADPVSAIQDCDGVPLTVETN